MSPDRATSLQDILGRLPISVVIASVETGEILWVNNRDMELAGATMPQQIVGHNLLEFIEPAQHGIALRDLEGIAAGESPPAVIYKLRRLDGGSADVQISSIPVRFQGRAAMLSLCADVTESQRAARALAESEQRYRELVENSPDGVVVVADEDRIVYANPALLCALRVESAETLVGRSMYDFIAAEYRKRVRAARRRVVSTGGSQSAAPVTLLRPDGTTLDTTAQTARICWEGEHATQTIMHGVCDPDSA